MAIDLSVFLLPVRAVQAVFSIIVLGTLAYTANAWSNILRGWGGGASAPSQVSFLIFCAVWTWLVLAYVFLAPKFAPAATHRFAALGVEAITMLFWFAGFIALAAALGGCGSSWGPCRAASAGTAFAAFEWLLFSFTTTVAALAAFGSSGSKAEATTTESGPAMTVP